MGTCVVCVTFTMSPKIIFLLFILRVKDIHVWVRLLLFLNPLNMYQRDAGGGVRLMRVCILPLCLFIYFPFFWIYSTAQIQKKNYPHTHVCFFIVTLNQ